MKLWTSSEPFSWPVADTDPSASEVPGGMLDGLGRRHFVRYLGATPPTQADLDAQVNPSPAQVRDGQKESARALFDKPTAVSALHRAELKLILTEINTLRSWVVSLKAAVVAATTLADMKIRVAALPDMPDRTAAQVKAALMAEVDGE